MHIYTRLTTTELHAFSFPFFWKLIFDLSNLMPPSSSCVHRVPKPLSHWDLGLLDTSQSPHCTSDLPLFSAFTVMVEEAGSYSLALGRVSGPVASSMPSLFTSLCFAASITLFSEACMHTSERDLSLISVIDETALCSWVSLLFSLEWQMFLDYISTRAHKQTVLWKCPPAAWEG